MILVIVFLILFGFLLLMAELFLVPGVTFVGLAGMVFMALGVYFIYDEHGILAGNLTLIVTLMASVFFVVRSFKSKAWERFQLKDKLLGKVNVHGAEQNDLEIGAQGIAISALRPTGTVRFGHLVREVESIAGFISAGQGVQFSGRDGSKMYVKPIN